MASGTFRSICIGAVLASDDSASNAGEDGSETEAGLTYLAGCEVAALLTLGNTADSAESISRCRV